MAPVRGQNQVYDRRGAIHGARQVLESDVRP